MCTWYRWADFRTVAIKLQFDGVCIGRIQPVRTGSIELSEGILLEQRTCRTFILLLQSQGTLQHVWRMNKQVIQAAAKELMVFESSGSSFTGIA